MRRAGIAIYIHAVWATWDRLPLLSGSFEQRIHHAIAARCTALRANVVALGGVDDHAHLLVVLPATLSLAELMRQVKGASSHLATHEPHEAHPTRASFKWQGAYGAISVSPDALPAVSAYIAHQRQHHAANTFHPEWEHLPDFQPAQAGFAGARKRVP
jgi:REP element-mobilizing transposase RayT